MVRKYEESNTGVALLLLRSLLTNLLFNGIDLLLVVHMNIDLDSTAEQGPAPVYLHSLPIATFFVLLAHDIEFVDVLLKAHTELVELVIVTDHAHLHKAASLEFRIYWVHLKHLLCQSLLQLFRTNVFRQIPDKQRVTCDVNVVKVIE